MAEIRTTCPYCGTGCGVVATVDEQGAVSVQGDTDHPANYGRLCSKGAALGETMGLEGRLLRPEIGGEAVSWDHALEHVAQGFAQVIAQHGPDAVAFYVSGQLLTEDYYVANKLMKGFIGSANIDSNSRLCMSSSVAGHKRAFGSDTVPGCYEDLEQADLVVLTGSNLAWCHPVLYQRICAAEERHPHRKRVVIDPRRTATCDGADLHLALKPGSDAVLFNGLLVYLADQQGFDASWMGEQTEGVEEALAEARRNAPDVAAVAAACELEADQVETFYRYFLTTEKAVTVYSQGINQSSSGSDKVNAILNCHLASGRIGRPGMGPFSVTGQPNAMGGREVGALANQLAAHMDFAPEDRERVGRFWHAPNLATQPGLMAVDLFEAIHAGTVKAVWIMGTNPVVSLPDADRVREALRRCELVVVSDMLRHTDTTACADVLLPALGWGEKSGTVTNSERCISRQRPFLSVPGEARPDWWILSRVAKHMGFGEAFDYSGPAPIFAEHCALSACENGGRRDFDLSGLCDLNVAAYDTLAPIQWPVGHDGRGTPRLFAAGDFFTPSGRAKMVPIVPRGPVGETGGDYPWLMNSGRIRDQWHTMTRTGRTARLLAHIGEPFVALNPGDADSQGIVDGSLVEVSSNKGRVILRALITADQNPGQLFVPMHWNDQFTSCGRIDALIHPHVDPLSGQPESKQTPVTIRPYAATFQALLLTRHATDLADVPYWSRIGEAGCQRYLLAGEQVSQDWMGWARRRWGAAGKWLQFQDPAQGRYRIALLVEGRLEMALFVEAGSALSESRWLSGLFEGDLTDTDRTQLLTASPGQDVVDQGRIVCACFGVGVKQITQVITEQQLTSVESIGAALQAGTHCGSCVPELRVLLGQVA